MFEHDLFHSGSPLEWGTKFVMRTDVLFEVQTNLVVDDEVKEENCHSALSRVENALNDEEKGNGSAMELLIHICDEMNLSEDDVRILDEMSLLHITPYAFISPGITMLKQMLIDGGIEEKTASSLIHQATLIVSKK